MNSFQVFYGETILGYELVVIFSLRNPWLMKVIWQTIQWLAQLEVWDSVVLLDVNKNNVYRIVYVAVLSSNEWLI
jgi:hypothetical protein